MQNILDLDSEKNSLSIYFAEGHKKFFSSRKMTMKGSFVGEYTVGQTRYSRIDIPNNMPSLVQALYTIPDLVCSGSVKSILDTYLEKSWCVKEAAMFWEPPEGLFLRPWQETNAKTFSEFDVLFCSDQPGTGKTISAISAIMEAKTRGKSVFPALVACPASMVNDWVKTVQKLTQYEAYIYPGKKTKIPANTPFVITSYNMVSGQPKVFKDHKFRTIVLDEHHLVKNPKTTRFEALKTIISDTRPGLICLSGTPITHSPADFWTMLRLWEPKTFPSYWAFVDRYCDTIDQDGWTKVAGFNPMMEAEFRDWSSSIFRRVTKRDALPFLPPKIYSTRVVKIPARWRKIYDDFDSGWVAELPSGETVFAPDVLTKLGILQRIASGPCDIIVEESDDPDNPPHIRTEPLPGGWKIGALLEVLTERPDSQVLVFAPSAKLVARAVDAVRESGVVCGSIIGGQSAAERSQTVEDFQAGRLRVLCLTTGAGGVGLTLTAADTVVFLSRPLSVVESLQAEDRAHRIGSEQHHSIEVIDIVAEDSVDQWVRGILGQRVDGLAGFLADEGLQAEAYGGTPT